MSQSSKRSVSPLSMTLALGLAASAAQAQPERILDTPAGWGWLYGATSSQIASQVNGGMRPFSFERTALGEYDTLFVQNSGPYAMAGGTVAYGQSAAGLTNTINNGNYRIVDLEVYENNGNTFMTAALVPNSGATGTPAWGWLYNVSFNDIVTWLNANPSLRLIDFDAYKIAGVQYYSAVAVHNSGNNFQSGWWYVAGATATQVTDLLQNNGARLIQIDVVNPGGIGQSTTFAALAVSSNPGAGWWYPSLTSQQVADLVNQNGARLTALKRYSILGQTRWAAAMVDNANAQTRRMRSYIGDAIQDGSYGFMLRQVNGPVLADLNSNFAYEPASVMKGLHAVYAIRQCSLGNDNLGTLVYNPNTCTTQSQANLCPSTWPICSSGNEPLSTTIQWMMQISHNARTRVIEERYGRATLNNFADNTLMLDNTQINHTLGCLNCGNNDYNTTTASDISALYERVNDGTLFNGAWRDTLAGLMLNLEDRGYGTYPTLSNVINQEAAQTNLTAAEIAEFRGLVQLANKGGRYGCGGLQYKGEGGWAEIPFKTQLLGNWVTTTRRYSFATFVHGTTDVTGSDIVYSAKEEILREQIREALETWDNACVSPGITQQPTNKTGTVGGAVTFTSTVVGTTGTIALQWQKQPSGGGSWSNLSNSGKISGATTTQLTISNLALSDAGSYRLVATAPCGSTTSSAATLTVNQVQACYANCDGSTGSPALNVADFGCFLNKFAAQDPYANCDGSTGTPALNVADFGCFLSKFAAGCQ